MHACRFTCMSMRIPDSDFIRLECIGEFDAVIRAHRSVARYGRNVTQNARRHLCDAMKIQKQYSQTHLQLLDDAEYASIVCVSRWDLYSINLFVLSPSHTYVHSNPRVVSESIIISLLACLRRDGVGDEIDVRVQECCAGHPAAREGVSTMGLYATRSLDAGQVVSLYCRDSHTWVLDHGRKKMCRTCLTTSSLLICKSGDVDAIRVCSSWLSKRTPSSAQQRE
jgi:hypothetical protein